MTNDIDFTNEDNSGDSQMEGFPLAEPGWHVAIITSAEKKETRDGKGAYLNLRIQIVEGDDKDCSWFHMINLWNKSEKAVKIARGQLSCYRQAVGKTLIKSSRELLDIPFRVSVGVKKGNQGYRDSNYTKDAEALAQKSNVAVKGISLEEDEVPSFS